MRRSYRTAVMMQPPVAPVPDLVAAGRRAAVLKAADALYPLVHHLLRTPQNDVAALADALLDIRQQTSLLEEPSLREPIVSMYLAVKTMSEANRAAHAHWRERAARSKGQKEYAYLQTFVQLRKLGRSPLPCTVYLRRVAPRALDPGDNYNGAFKHLRDGIALAMEVDDADPRVAWAYLPGVKGRPNEYAVTVDIMERKPLVKEL